MDLIQPFAAIVLVMGLLGGTLLLLKRRGVVTFFNVKLGPIKLPGMQAAGPRRLEVIERVSLGPHHALHLVRTGDRCVLIATTPSSCQLMDAGEKF